MLKEWLSIEQAAELEGISYNAMQLRISSGCTMAKKSCQNGKNRVYVLLSSLSSKARRLYRQQKKLETDGIIDEDNAPWYVSIDVQTYKEKYIRQYNKAIEMKRYVEECISYDGGKDKTEYISSFAESLGISARTLQRKIKAYTEASAWALELGGDEVNLEYMKILALCPQPAQPKGRRALTVEMKALIENIWFDPIFAANRCKYAKLYRLFCSAMLEKGTAEESLPSYDTVLRYIRDDLRPETDNARVLVSDGLREFKRTSMVKARRDLTRLRVMELVVADTHTFDCFVEVSSKNGAKRAVKPCLVGFMDMRSRALVGWSICEIPNAQVIKETLIHMIMPKKNKANPFEGVPRVLLIDNGKDYTAECLTGRNRKVRVSIDTDTEGFYAEAGIERDTRSLPYQAWTKGQIERFFGGVCEDFTKSINTYTGTLTGSLTSNKVKKDIKAMFEKGQLMSIEDFADKFEYWVLEVYSKRNHSGLREQKEQWKTPLEVYRNAERYYKPAPPVEYLRRMAMVKEHKKVYATGIRLLGCNYMCEALFPYINSSRGVTVRYDPHDVTSIYVYDVKSDKLICRCGNATILDPLAPVDDKSLEAHIKAQRKQEKQAREIIARAQMPYEERMAADNIADKSKVVILPELEEGEQKVVAMPRSTNYIKENEDKKDMQRRNEWLRSQAEGVMRELGIGG